MTELKTYRSKDLVMSFARSLLFGAFAALAAASAAPGLAAAASNAPAAAAPAPVPAPGTAPAAAPAAKAPPPELVEGVAAIVNDEIISSYDLRQRMLLLLVTSGVQPTQENIGAIEKEALRSLVDERIELQEIRSVEKKQKDLHLQPTAKEVDGEVADMAKESGLKSEQLFATLRSAGVEPQTLRDQIAVQMAWRHYMGGRFGQNIHIGDEQVQAAEARLLAAAEKPQYLVSEIFIDSSRVGGDAQAMDGARQLEAQIRQGAPFPSVARQFSSLPTAANGGDAGWLVSSEIDPALEPVLAAMRPGQLSEPIPTGKGVYILMLRDKKAGTGATLVDLRQAAVRLAPDAPPTEVAAAQSKLETLKAAFEGCKTFDAAAAKVPGVSEGDLGETDLTELKPSFREVVETLKVGQIGGPVRTDAGLHLIALCGRHLSGAKAPTHDDLENRLYGEQLSMVARRFLRDLHNSATIESR